jgi:hypothetical protein|tara:strand:- start:2433 stop:2606 length:174 start_codon:yes stop_codon:yes gene_type:complete
LPDILNQDVDPCELALLQGLQNELTTHVVGSGQAFNLRTTRSIPKADIVSVTYLEVK